jgi:hypothetical protein
MFITIVETDEAFDWTPVNEDTGEAYTSTFQLRLVTDEADQEIRKRHTRPVWDKKQRRTIDKLNEPAYVAEVVDHAIVGWTGIKAAASGAELPCTSAMKARLPEKWKAEILRLCSGKEAGEVVAQTEQEKKRSATISPSKPTPAGISSAA